MRSSTLFLGAISIATLGWGGWAAAHNPDGQVDVTALPDAYLILIRDPVVLREIHATETQRAKLAELADEIDGPLWTLRNQPADKALEGFRDLVARAEQRVEPLLSATQRKRLEQLRLAAHGLKLFLRDEVVSALKLSDEQQAKIRRIIENPDPKPTAELTATKPAARPRSPNESRARQVSDLLSREQSERLRGLLGPVVDLGKLGRVRFKAPELDGQDGWLQSSPLTLAQLHGQVVALHFYTAGCINCIHNYPAYRGWQETLVPRGLTIIGIHTPEGSGDRDVPTIGRKATEAQLEFPILVDNSRGNWNAWGNSMWPTVYLIDKRGYVRYWWMGELNWKGATGEQLFRTHIEELLAEKP